MKYLKNKRQQSKSDNRNNDLKFINDILDTSSINDIICKYCNNEKYNKLSKRLINNYLLRKLKNENINEINSLLTLYFRNNNFNTINLYNETSINIILNHLYNKLLETENISLLFTSYNSYNLFYLCKNKKIEYILLFKNLLKIIFENSKSRIIKKKILIKNIILCFSYYFKNIYALSTKQNNNILKYVNIFNMLCNLFDDSNIYLDKYIIDKLLIISNICKYYNIEYNKLSNLYKLIGKHILDNEQHILTFNKFKNLNSKIIKLNLKKIGLEIIGKNIYNSFNKIFNTVLCEKYNFKKYDKINKLFIIDGRNAFYNKNIKSNNSNLDLKNMKNYLNSSYDKIITFNIKHKDLIEKFIKTYFSNVKDCTYKNNKNYKYILYNKDKNTKTGKKSLLQQIDYTHIKIEKFDDNNSLINETNITFIFTPRYIDDDLMTIYLKLNIPNSFTFSNDKYGKYSCLIHNNNYYYNLWCKMFDIM
jgi:hypothetical protein